MLRKQIFKLLLSLGPSFIALFLLDKIVFLKINSSHFILIPVVFASWYGGFIPGIAALIITTIGADYFIARHLGFFRLDHFLPVISSAAITFVVGFLVAKEKKAKEEIKKLSLHDHLTGLPNRRLLEERLSFQIKSAARHKRKLAVMFLDLDKFKSVNDTLGHEIGDLLLKEVAVRLQSSVRKEDTVARLGGDEFVILLAEIKEKNGVETVAKKIITELSSEFYLNEHMVKTSTSVGISVFPSDGDTAEILLKKADDALYDVKKNNRNNFKFYKDIG